MFDAGAVHFGLGEGPQILILHSHGSEAYSQNDGDLYQESDAYRTTDCTHNVVRVGEAMAEVFRGQGFQVIHDTNLYDYPAYNGSYDRSKAAVRDWLAKYPTIRIILDVHRDALVGSDGSIYKLVTQENGKKDRPGHAGGGYRRRRGAASVLDRQSGPGRPVPGGLISDYVSLARPIVLRNSSYNQQLSPGYLLVEVGGHGNTLTEAVDGGPPLCPERQPGAEHHVGHIMQKSDRSRDAAPKRPEPVTEKRIKMKRTCLLQGFILSKSYYKRDEKYYITFKFSRDWTDIPPEAGGALDGEEETR